MYLKGLSLKKLFIFFGCWVWILVYGFSVEGMELTDFAVRYGFRYRIDLKKGEVILRKGGNEVSFLKDSRVALVNGKRVWFLDSGFKEEGGALILPRSFIQKLLDLDSDLEGGGVNERSFGRKRGKNKIRFIILDAGHGGKDPGNTHHGILEKEINLKIVKRLARFFRGRLSGVKVILTRGKDRFISLKDRSDQGLKWNRLDYPGIFVSIHANASLNSETRGVETYFYGSKKDLNQQEVRLMCLRLLTQKVSGSSVVNRVLANLYDLQVSRESYNLARSVNDHLYGEVSKWTLNRGVKAHKSYFVITHNNLASILVEVGFLSHKEEGLRLMDSKYQKRITRGIGKGIELFIEKYNENEGFF